MYRQHKLLTGLLACSILYLPLWNNISLQRFLALIVPVYQKIFQGLDLLKKEVDNTWIVKFNALFSIIKIKPHKILSR